MIHPIIERRRRQYARKRATNRVLRHILSIVIGGVAGLGIGKLILMWLGVQ